MVPENLEVLADLVLDVAVCGMKDSEILLEGVHLFQREGSLPEPSDTHENIRRPASHFRGFPAKEGESLPRGPHMLLRHDPLGCNYGDPSVVWKSVEQDVTADPSRAPRRRCERRTLFNHRSGHEVCRDRQEVGNPPHLSPIMH